MPGLQDTLARLGGGETHVNQAQKIVGIGAASGVVLMVLGVWTLTGLLPPPSIPDALGERLAYAAAGERRCAGTAVPHVDHRRQCALLQRRDRSHARSREPQRCRSTRASPPTRSSRHFGFAIASLALSTLVPLHQLQVVWACTIVFVVARAVFWIGYRMNPLYRAPGFSATAYLNLGMIGYVLYQIL